MPHCLVRAAAGMGRIIPVESEETGMESITDRRRKNLELLNLTTQQPHKLSLSFGISHYDPAHDDSLDNVLTRADRLMLEQKVLKRRTS